jgi:NAD(P)H-flavin reductase/Ca2+-binding EF-hand superfamily protein
MSGDRISSVDARLLETLERAFEKHAGADGVIDLKELQKALGLRSEYLARRVLASLDQNADGVISRDEFMGGVKRLVFGGDRDKLAFAFKMHDHDADGFIGRDELLRMIAISLGENDVATRESQPPERLAHALLTQADTNGDGRISFDEFAGILDKRPELLRKMTRSEALWIAPSEDLLARFDEEPAAKEGRFARLGENGWLPVVFVVGWIVANGWVLASALLAHPGEATNAAVRLGRATARCLDFDAALILVPVMRRLLTRVRASVLGRVVPVDHAMGFHKLVGHTLFALAVVHGYAFLWAFAAGHPSSPFLHLMGTQRGATGVVLLVLFKIMWAFAIGPVRRSSHFELFYFTHLLYVAWIALAIAHAPSILPWIGLPLAGFAIEQLVRLRRRGKETVVLDARALRSGVTRLELQRPTGFAYRAADYVFLRIPEIARHEWHPFTLSSAPESDSLTVHVRSLGNWTAALRRRVEDAERRGTKSDKPMIVHVDGPYGSPSAPIYDARFAVLIGAGIGVTPFASILESLVLRGKKRLEKVHFFWLNRDQYSFEWFVDLISELERIDEKHLLDVHLCMTGGRTGGTAVGLEIARELLHAQGERDIVTGLRTMTHMGHPDWGVVLSAIKEQHTGETVEVYFCGPPALGKKLRSLATKLGMPFREEQF